jgi:peroxiredoxin
MNGPFYLSYGVLWAIVIFQSLVVIGLVRALYDRRTPEAPTATESSGMAGETLPDFTVDDVFGAPIESRSLLGRPTALLFVSPDCESCAVTLQELDALVRRMDGNVVVFCRSDPSRCRSMAHHYGLGVPVACDEDRAVGDLLRVSATPTAVLVGADGRIESYGHPMSPEDLERQVAERGSNGVSEASELQPVIVERAGANGDGRVS